MKGTLKLLTGRLKAPLLLILLLFFLSLSGTAQWTTNGTNIYNSNTGNVGIGTNAPASKFQVLNGESRFGGATNYTKVGSGGNLLFNGAAVTVIASNKYVFKQNLAGNRGLYVNQTNKCFEFRDSSANDLFHVDYYKGDGYFKGRLGIGSTSVPDESNLVLGGNNSTEGGQLQLNSPTSGYTTAWFLDVHEDDFRITPGTNTASGNAKFIINQDGRVGIGIEPTEYLTVISYAGTIGTFANAGWMHSSDERLKTNIKPLENALDKIVKLQGVSFNWKSAPNRNNQIGFIAQEVERVFPEVVAKGPDGHYGMVSQNLVAPVVEAIKEQQKEIEEKDKTIKNLEDAIANLQNEHTWLTSQLDASENALSQWLMSNKQANSSFESPMVEGIAKLEQNNPNPFNEKTIMRCYIPHTASAATVKIYSLAGDEVQSLPVTTKGINQLEIAAGRLPSGTYNYLLIVDGKMVDTKEMILTQ